MFQPRGKGRREFRIVSRERGDVRRPEKGENPRKKDGRSQSFKKGNNGGGVLISSVEKKKKKEPALIKGRASSRRRDRGVESEGRRRLPKEKPH